MINWVKVIFYVFFASAILIDSKGQINNQNSDGKTKEKSTLARKDYPQISFPVEYLEEKKSYVCLYPQLELTNIFHDVAVNEIFEDIKVFANSRPKGDISLILLDYEQNKKNENFDLKNFLDNNFLIPKEKKSSNSSKNISIDEHIDKLWEYNYFKGDTLSSTKNITGTVADENSTSIQVLYPYIATNKQYNYLSYWDSFFLLLGLINTGESQAAIEMIKNFRNIIDKFGYAPPSNKCYNIGYTSPPIMPLMLNEMYGQDYTKMRTFIKALEKENKYWMISTLPKVSQNFVSNKHVMLFRTTTVNRYYVNAQIPTTDNYLNDLDVFYKKYKPASYYTDTELNIFVQLNSMKESAWGMSSRWLKDPKDNTTIMITDLAPVDLNTFLFMQEDLLYRYYRYVGETTKMNKYFNQSEDRRKIILKYNWNEKEDFFVDYDFANANPMNQLTLAGVLPLYAKIANIKQARHVAKVIKDKFLKKYGVITSEDDNYNELASHSWSPMVYFTIVGLNNYGYTKLANEIKNKWLENVKYTYNKTAKLHDKYNAIFQTNYNEKNEKEQSNIATSGIYRYFAK